jgi:hypothetical protein
MKKEMIEGGDEMESLQRDISYWDLGRVIHHLER